jgi:beta-lactamase class A
LVPEEKRVSYSDLMERMITLSSNLATNILIQEVGAERVTATMRGLGADSIQKMAVQRQLQIRVQPDLQEPYS